MRLSELITAIRTRCDREAAWHDSGETTGNHNNGSTCVPTGEDDVEVGSIHYRAQDVRPGGLFVAIKGHSADGHNFIDRAVLRGAKAVVAERKVSANTNTITVTDSRKAMGELAAFFYGDPAKKLYMIGITGTNGKTTTSYLIESILSSAGFQPGVIGTINYRYAGNVFTSSVTTPESVDLQGILAEMRDSGVSHVVMEISSHGIDLERIRGCAYDTAIFTNLSQDHLDYHGTMSAYWACKQRLFDDYLRSDNSSVVVNIDDSHGFDLAKRLSVKTISTGRSENCAVRSLNTRIDLDGISGTIATPATEFAYHSRLVGTHNLENILCATGTAVSLGIPVEAVKAGIEQVASIPGRLERIQNNKNRFVFVDYAHTPDALENALGSLTSISENRIICVFGCGGDRDRKKRPMMGKIAGKGSDLAIVTSDNPRSEDPLAIIEDAVKGTQKTGGVAYTADRLRRGFEKSGYIAEPDRRKAINLAVSVSRPGDTILIAGKGHETYQVLKNETINFDDRKEAEMALGNER